jgi:hypothetical protein
MYMYIHKMHMVMAYKLGVSRVRVYFQTCDGNMNIESNMNFIYLPTKRET